MKGRKIKDIKQNCLKRKTLENRGKAQEKRAVLISSVSKPFVTVHTISAVV